MSKNKGLSLIEILLVIGIAAGIFLFSAPYGIKYYKIQLIDEARSNIVEALQRARHNAVLQKNDSRFGVHLSLGEYVIFQGNTYDERDQEQDEVFSVIDDITFSTSTDIIFSKLVGTTTPIVISVDYGDLSKSINIEESGNISKIN